MFLMMGLNIVFIRLMACDLVLFMMLFLSVFWWNFWCSILKFLLRFMFCIFCIYLMLSLLILGKILWERMIGLGRVMVIMFCLVFSLMLKYLLSLKLIFKILIVDILMLEEEMEKFRKWVCRFLLSFFLFWIFMVVSLVIICFIFFCKRLWEWLKFCIVVCFFSCLSIGFRAFCIVML